MGTLTIRNLDDQVIDRLKAQAQANQRSLEGEVRHVLADHTDRRSRMAEFRERTKRLASATAGTPQSDSVTLLRADRDR
ncbi:MAG: TraY domain-containing protein [Acidobacteria bacterium]|nr:TraY domain-containing protein [Acidobacteriota bacterium]